MKRRSAIIAILACASAFSAQALTPRRALSETLPPLNLEALIPEQVGDWQTDKGVMAAVVNPQQEAMIQAIYSETLSRTYVNSRGERVMLSIAYGSDQRDGLQVHKPEVCYPAQGFLVKATRADSLQLESGAIPVRRVETVFGNSRPEPVTYWMTVGEEVVVSGLDKKLAEMRYSLEGVYPDGLLFRVSSIGADTSAALQLQDGFLREIIGAIDPAFRHRFAGKASTR
ncbi:EpsI family protein [Azoarcus communis]|uniref:exosortase-associated protein EpsI, B-type n=1 Tax=Parazoarcus communis TaxID=41977 RepID=UPI001459BA1E|nr:exosortase-associated protein EpsI, B-type [Parazoarcus communis]NMG47268.1 EpsI family protein [Parazoarcus communis]